jgi:hypothetical protein
MTRSQLSAAIIGIILSTLSAAFTAGCAGSESSGGKAPLGEEFTLRMGESTTVGDNLRLTFEAVEEDSRCPEGVTCVWEGNARVRLGYITPDHPPIALHLNTSGRFARDTTVQRYHIELRALLPAKKEGVEIKPADYSARLMVTNN